MARKGNGIEVIDQWETKGHERGKRWFFRVWDPRRRSRVSEAFDDLAPGWEWAERKRAQLTLGLTVSGRVLLSLVGQEFIDGVIDRGGNADHPKDIQRVVDAVVAAGAVDMASDTFAASAYQWLKTATSFDKRRQKPVSPATRNKWFSYLRWIVNHARAKGRITNDPFFGYDWFIAAEKSKETFQIDEIRRLVSDEHRDHPYWLRFVLMIYSGRRLNEALHSRWEWFDWSENQVDVRRHPEYKIKRNKERKIPLQPELAEILRSIPDRPETGWVIADKKLRNPNNKQAWDQFRKFLKDCGVIARVDYPKYDPEATDQADAESIRRLSPHSTRHSYIALRLATGESISQVRREAGHADTETTDLYADAEASYRPSVKEWPRGVLCFRKTPAEHNAPVDQAPVVEPAPALAANVIRFPVRAGTAPDSQPPVVTPAADR